MQRAYMSKLMQLAEKDSNVLHLIADSGTGFDEMLRRNFPEQIFNFGISENHMTATAAGLATAGKISFIYTAGAFLAYRSFEFIRNDICFQNLNVKIVGMGSGLSWSTLGPSHHTTEDTAILRVLPNLTMLSPATPLQTSACTELAYRINGPVYMKIGMNNEREFFDENYVADAKGRDIIFDFDDKDIVVFSAGSILEEAFSSVEILADYGIKAGLVNVYSLKPFDYEVVYEAAKYAKIFVSIEEHNIYGGLGGIISEAITERGLPIKLIRIGLCDKFADGYGTHDAVRDVNGLSAEKISDEIMRRLL